MGIASDIAADWDAAFAALAYQVELGVTEVIGDAPVDRYDLAPAAPMVRATAPEPVPQPAPDAAPAGDGVTVARAAAAAAADLGQLQAALAAFDHCDLKRGARSTVFADGLPGARVMLVGEAPGREEDLEGRPFVGRAGQLLDRMFAAIGLSRQATIPAQAIYITNVLPWRPPQNRDPLPEEVALLRPFLERHIALARPDVLVALGNTPLQALTGGKGILRARGTWVTALGLPLLPMTHPAYLLRNPLAKREAWADLQSLRARLNG